MRDSLTDITVILDRSGSMQTVATDTIGGLNKFVSDQKALPGDANFTLVQFDDQYELVHSSVPIKDVPLLTFQPRGWTALLDAIGRTINETGQRLAAISETDRPGRVLMVILTDGHENKSVEFTRPKINEMITHQKEAYQWQFLFLGANQDAIATAATMGIAKDAAMTYDHSGGGVAMAFAASSRAAVSYRSAGVAPVYCQSDRDEQNKLLAKAKS